MSRPVIALLLVFFMCSTAHAGSLGRLFFTSEQRKQLDANAVRPATAGKKPAMAQVLNGIVQRTDGTRTIWINGVAKIEDGNGQAPDVQLFMLPGEPQPVAIKVGQHVLPGRPARE